MRRHQLISPIILLFMLVHVVAAQPQERGYADVNGLQIYYEIHGEGEPLLMLHGGFMHAGLMGPIVPELAAGRRVIAVDLEGHGRTVDLERPLSYEQMADDVAALMAELGIDRTDVFGYSMGGGVAMRMAIQHPELIRRLITVSTHHRRDAYYPSITAMWPGMSADQMAGTPMEEGYLAVAPQPERWPAFVAKMRDFMLSHEGWPDEDVSGIDAPTLLIFADSDFYQLDHLTDLYQLIGGAGPDAWQTGTPEAQLAIIPRTTHFDILYQTHLLVPIVVAFLSGE